MGERSRIPTTPFVFDLHHEDRVSCIYLAEWRIKAAKARASASRSRCRVERMFKVVPARFLAHGKRCGSSLPVGLVGRFAVFQLPTRGDQAQIPIAAPWSNHPRK